MQDDLNSLQGAAGTIVGFVGAANQAFEQAVAWIDDEVVRDDFGQSATFSDGPRRNRLQTLTVQRCSPAWTVV